MRKIERITRFKVCLDNGPDCTLCGIRDEHLNDGTAFYGFLDRKERLAGYPTISNCTIPISFEFLCLANDYVETIVFHVERLRRSLNPITDNGNNLVF